MLHTRLIEKIVAVNETMRERELGVIADVNQHCNRFNVFDVVFEEVGAGWGVSLN